MESNTARIVFQPSGKSGRVPCGISLVEAARRLGVGIVAACGEKHLCGKCRVRIVTGSFEKYGLVSDPYHASPWQESEGDWISVEERQAGFRLGCIATVQGDLMVFIPEESRTGQQVISKTARSMAIDLNPAVKRYRIEVAPPTLEVNRGDFERLRDALQQRFGLRDLSIDLAAARSIARAMRAGDWQVTVSVWMDREIIRLRPGARGATLGLALDVGTTTIAAYLCDLATGELVNTASAVNPQVKYGDDVLSRISYHMQHADGLERMRGDLVAALNALIDQLLAEAPRKPQNSGTVMVGDADPGAFERDDIEDVAVVCNTVMQHILLGLDPEPLGAIPFTPAMQHSLDIKARDLGIRVNPSAYVFFLPNIAGYVGSDHVAVILAEAPHKSDARQLIIDIGTNGELVVGNRERLVCCSCATGPALEGAQIECGMRASEGAIERVRIDPRTHEVDYKVIGRSSWRSSSEPKAMQVRGICGSGILDALAELFRAGVVGKSGAFNKGCGPSARLRPNPRGGQIEFVLAWAEETVHGKEVVITQKDIRQVQLAKAAIYTGCKLLLRRMNLSAIDAVKIAGAFGNHLDPRGALAIGLLPDCPLESVAFVGNAAGDGCRMALLDRGKRSEANWIARSVECLKLALEPDFQRELMESTQLPHMTDSFPHLL